MNNLPYASAHQCSQQIKLLKVIWLIEKGA